MRSLSKINFIILVVSYRQCFVCGKRSHLKAVAITSAKWDMSKISVVATAQINPTASDSADPIASVQW